MHVYKDDTQLCKIRNDFENRVVPEKHSWRQVAARDDAHDPETIRMKLALVYPTILAFREGSPSLMGSID